MTMISRRTACSRMLAAAGATLASLALGGPAQAGLTIVNLSGGWQASWDSALDPFVDLNDHGVVNGALFLEKSAQFTQGPVNGVFPSIDITFTQVSANAVANIVLDDEIITNSTGSPWTDFHMDLLGSSNVAFDPIATAASGGFSVNPFTSSSFTNANQTFNAFNGTIPNGSTWFPGAVSGQLWIHVSNISPTSGITFTLSERPTPAPGVLGLLSVGLVCGSRRRRS